MTGFILVVLLIAALLGRDMYRAFRWAKAARLGKGDMHMLLLSYSAALVAVLVVFVTGAYVEARALSLLFGAALAVWIALNECVSTVLKALAAKEQA